jgi:hypothetical protein
MEYQFMLPSDIVPADAKTVRLIGCDHGGEKDVDTWKEAVVSREWDVVHIYNLVSHGRRMYRSLIFTSKSQFALHCLPPLIRDEPLPLVIKHAAGDMKKRRLHEGQLVISRRNTLLGGQETFVPSRLLQGVLPSAILEAYTFWQGEDLVLRGEPLDSSSQWFNFNVEVTLATDAAAADGACSRAILRRRALGRNFRRISSKQMDTQSALVRHRSKINATTSPSDSESVAQLMALGFSAAAATLALRANGQSVDKASNWLLDEANAGAIDAEDAAAATAAEAEPAPEKDDNVTPRSESALSRTNSSRETAVELLVQRGFSAASAAYALQIYHNDVALAQAWLNDPKNEEEIGQLEASDVANVAPAATAAPATDSSDDWLLLNLVETHGNDSVLHRVAAALSRLEDLSHVLAWTTGDSDSDTECCITLIVSSIIVSIFCLAVLRCLICEMLSNTVLRRSCPG